MCVCVCVCACGAMWCLFLGDIEVGAWTTDATGRSAPFVNRIAIASHLPEARHTMAAALAGAFVSGTQEPREEPCIVHQCPPRRLLRPWRGEEVQRTCGALSEGHVVAHLWRC